MSTSAEVFRNVVVRTLKSWSGLQLAIDNSCGGDETKEKANWLTDVICEYVSTTRSLKAEDFEEWLTNILYHDFDLILEDDSVYQIAFFLLEGFGYCKNNNEAGLQQLLSGLPSDEELAKAKKQSVRGAEEEDMEMDEIPDDEDDEKEGEPSEPQPSAPRRVKEVDEDGWTTIVRR